MIKISTQHEINLATDSIRALRSAINSTHRGAVGQKAKAESQKLTAHVKSADIAVDTVRSNQFNPTIQQLVLEHERLSKTAEGILRDFASAVKYDGPVRSSMTLKEKSNYISTHGAEGFFSLPE